MKDAFGGCPFQLGWTMFNYVGVDVQFELTQSSVKTNRIWHERDATLTSLQIFILGTQMLPSVSSSVQNLTLKY